MRDGAPIQACRLRSGNACRLRYLYLGWPAEAKEEEQRQTSLVRAYAAKQGEMGHHPGRAHS